MEKKSEFAIFGVKIDDLKTMMDKIMVQTGLTDPKEVVKMINSDKLQVSLPKWIEKDGIIYVSVTSRGMSGKEWITYFGNEGVEISEDAKRILLSERFKPTNGITYEVAIIKGDSFVDDGYCTAKTINKKAEDCKFFTPDIELACLLRQKFSSKELRAMDFSWIVVMHDPVVDCEKNFLQLCVCGIGNKSKLFATFQGGTDGQWGVYGGFAFIASKKQEHETIK